ncbi:type IV secretion system DNA-binding domain-containing protein [Vulcanisaeta sp. JCM 14467]|uniref:type IV secretion system DNA-binding domain-containing protein n=1 Tax=Vulcanisaeta sp. JCM 14467 TaxID=1295370 RepID=UPI002093682B|nr:type IV secretion system DNA-binding domain-containing protein [Vulcanisaeta sp. JCM 14467]
MGGLTFKAVINEPAKHLFRLMVLDETHALIFGAIGTGKTTLIKNALVDVPQDYTVVVFDIAGSYEVTPTTTRHTPSTHLTSSATWSSWTCLMRS